MWIGPAPGNQVAVPAQERGRLDEAPSLVKAREQSPQSGQHGPIGWLQHWTLDRAWEYRDFVAQDDDLDRKIGVLATGETDQLEDATERPV